MSAPEPARRKWQAAGIAARYATERFASDRARERDPNLVRRLLRRSGIDLAAARTLDVPCGTGRLAPLLAGGSLSYVGVDASVEMLRRGPTHGLVADAVALPFAADRFELVVCCRLLHHLEPRTELPAVVRELVRVSSRFVFASFWDAASLPAWRRRVGLRVESGRRPVSKRHLESCFASAGAEVFRYAHSARLLSMQTFAAARKRD